MARSVSRALGEGRRRVRVAGEQRRTSASRGRRPRGTSDAPWVTLDARARLLGEVGVRQLALDERDRQDPHQRPVAAAPPRRRPPRSAGTPRPSLCRAPRWRCRCRTPCRPGRSRRCCATRAPGVPGPRGRSPGREQRVEQRQHERAVVAPGARRLMMRPVPAPGDSPISEADSNSYGTPRASPTR